MREKSIPVPTLTVHRKSGPEHIDYSIPDQDEVSIGINGRGYYVRLREDGTLVIRGMVAGDPQLVVAFQARGQIILTVRDSYYEVANLQDEPIVEVQS